VTPSHQAAVPIRNLTHQKSQTPPGQGSGIANAESRPALEVVQALKFRVVGSRRRALCQFCFHGLTRVNVLLYRTEMH